MSLLDVLKYPVYIKMTLEEFSTLPGPVIEAAWDRLSAYEIEMAFAGKAFRLYFNLQHPGRLAGETLDALKDELLNYNGNST